MEDLYVDGSVSKLGQKQTSWRTRLMGPGIENMLGLRDHHNDEEGGITESA